MTIAHIVATVLFSQLHWRHGLATKSRLSNVHLALTWTLADRVKGAAKGWRLLQGKTGPTQDYMNASIATTSSCDHTTDSLCQTGRCELNC